MAALSDYLESGLLSHIFFGQEFVRPTSLGIALTSSVPKDLDSGMTMDELPSGDFKGSRHVLTGYSRVDLGPANVGSGVWNQVGKDSTTAFQINSSESGVGLPPNSGYFYPLYLSVSTAQAASPSNAATQYTFSKTFPEKIFYGPNGVVVSGDYATADPGYTEYEGNGFIKNKNQITFSAATTDWGWISGIAVLDNTNHASGNILMYAQLQNPRYIYTGDSIKFDTNSLEISLK